MSCMAVDTIQLLITINNWVIRVLIVISNCYFFWTLRQYNHRTKLNEAERKDNNKKIVFFFKLILYYREAHMRKGW